MSTDNVYEMGGHDNMNVEETLSVSARAELTEVLIVGFTKDGDLYIASSEMTRKDGLWLAELAKQNAFKEI